MDYASGDPTDEIDIRMMSDLEGLLRSMENDDHVNDSSPHRFYIDCTIEYHAQKIVSSLGLSCADESTRVTPPSIPDGPTLKTASFIMERLSDTFGTISWEQPRQLFHDGMREVYNRLINIFIKPVLIYSDHQKQLIQGILEAIEELSRSTTVTTHEDIQLRFYGFLDSLRIDRPRREHIEHDGEYLINPEGFISMAIEDATWELLFLQKVSEDHFTSFSLYVLRIPNIVPIITRHFIRLYPHYPRIPVSATSGPGVPSFY